MTAHVTDVAIVGSGLVGSAFAIAAANAGLSVAIVEAREASNRAAPVPFDLRAYALSLGSVRFLTRLGVWAELDHSRWEPFREMHVWDAGHRSELHFAAADVDVEMLGAIAEDWSIQRALERVLRAHENVTWFRPATMLSFEARAGAVDIVLDGNEIQARLLVGADGTRSQVRTALGITHRSGTYGQRAIVTLAKTEKPHEQTAWQRFLAGGPLAFLPMPDGYCSIVWSAPEPEAEALIGLDDQAFAHQLHRAFDGRLGRVEWVGARAAFPLVWLSVDRYVGTRAALLGDAAHTIHPLAGQGVNLGLMDAASLAELVADAHSRGRDIASPSVLRGYERWRKAHNIYVEAAMGSLLWLFGKRGAGWRGVRGLGLAATQSLPGGTELFSRLAMGLLGDLPKSYRPLPESLREANA